MILGERKKIKIVLDAGVSMHFPLSWWQICQNAESGDGTENSPGLENYPMELKNSG